MACWYILNGMRYSYNPCTVYKPMHYHLVPDFTTNPTSFIRPFSWEDCASQTEFSQTMPSWQDAYPKVMKNVLCVLADHIQQHVMSRDNTPETLLSLSLDFSKERHPICAVQIRKTLGPVLKFDMKWYCKGFIMMQELWQYTVPFRRYKDLTLHI